MGRSYDKCYKCKDSSSAILVRNISYCKPCFLEMIKLKILKQISACDMVLFSDNQLLISTLEQFHKNPHSTTKIIIRPPLLPGESPKVPQGYTLVSDRCQSELAVEAIRLTCTGNGNAISRVGNHTANGVNVVYPLAKVVLKEILYWHYLNGISYSRPLPKDGIELLVGKFINQMERDLSNTCSTIHSTALKVKVSGNACSNCSFPIVIDNLMDYSDMCRACSKHAVG